MNASFFSNQTACTSHDGNDDTLEASEQLSQIEDVESNLPACTTDVEPNLAACTTDVEPNLPACTTGMVLPLHSAVYCKHFP